MLSLVFILDTWEFIKQEAQRPSRQQDDHKLPDHDRVSFRPSIFFMKKFWIPTRYCQTNFLTKPQQPTMMFCNCRNMFLDDGYYFHVPTKTEIEIEDNDQGQSNYERKLPFSFYPLYSFMIKCGALFETKHKNILETSKRYNYGDLCICACPNSKIQTP